MVHICLSEHEQKKPQFKNEVWKLALESDEHRGIAEELTRSGKLTVYELRDGLYLKASSYVGRIDLGTVQVSIKPKIGGNNLLSLLRYVYRLSDLKSDVDYRSDDLLFHDLLINQLANEATILISRGLHRRYNRIMEDLASPRGRIDIQGIISNGGITKAALPCIHHPRLDNWLLNSVLLEGLLMGIKMTDDIEIKSRLHRLASILSETVTPIKLNRYVIQTLDQKMNRLTTAYMPAIQIIKILWESKGTGLDGPEPSIELPGFLYNMDLFFQRLLLKIMEDYLKGYTVNGKSLNGVISYEPNHNPQHLSTPTIMPDFIVSKRNKTVAILDAKYMDLWNDNYSVSNKNMGKNLHGILYQLAVYALGLGIGGKSVILYPTVSSCAQEEWIDINDPIHGVRCARVILRPINLIELNGLIQGRPAPERSCIEYARYIAFGRH
jgi:5-methylcytosine-specific restriction enzyme subunit McrC